MKNKNWDEICKIWAVFGPGCHIINNNIERKRLSIEDFTEKEVEDMLFRTHRLMKKK
jgi:hypothetical protein